MPTVPPTFISLDSDDELFQHPAVVSIAGDALGSPTPDPDLDDSVLVPVIVGDGLGAVTEVESLAKIVSSKSISLKPRLDLSDLSLHSPSSIVGTPFDVSPRFEYPFPPSGLSAESDVPSTSLSIITSPFLPSFPAVFLPTLPPSLPLSRPEARGHSPTHPRLQPRDPPVPPTLAKKRWSNTISGPIFSQASRLPNPRKRSRSSVSLKSAPDGSDESTASRDTERLEGRRTPSEANETMSQRSSSLSRDTRCRSGKGREVVHTSLSGPRVCNALSLGTVSSKEPSALSVSNAVAGQGPRLYPQHSVHDARCGYSA